MCFLQFVIHVQLFKQQQKNQFDIWVLHAVLANDLFTDDSFVVSVFFLIHLCFLFSQYYEINAIDACDSYCTCNHVSHASQNTMNQLVLFDQCIWFHFCSSQRLWERLKMPSQLCHWQHWMMTMMRLQLLQLQAKLAQQRIKQIIVFLLQLPTPCQMIAHMLQHPT
jgi:hypothetical protein